MRLILSRDQKEEELVLKIIGWKIFKVEELVSVNVCGVEYGWWFWEIVRNGVLVEDSELERKEENSQIIQGN